MTAYYNEFDPYAAQWLRNLISAGHLPAGDVDERSILEVKADDVRKYAQCHFFAGIGGWSYALQLARWPAARPIWTGSCPCQPFSVAGKQKAQKDERHLWPVWFKLIAEVRPPTIFGEQVAGAITHGWLDDAADDLEREGYETGAAVLPACSVGAPHRRDRLWFVAQSSIYRPQGRPWESTSPSIMGDAKYNGSSSATFTGSIVTPSAHDEEGQNTASKSTGTSMPGSSGDVANSTSRKQQPSGAQCDERRLQEAFLRESGYPHNWDVEPAVGRVANGVQARSHKLRAYGNAIVPQVAAEFITGFLEAEAFL